MTNYIGNMDGGQTSVEGHNRRTRLTMYSQGIMASGHLAVTQQSTPSTSVDVAAGDIFLFLNNYFLHGWASTTNTIAIAANSSGNPRIDKIVAYADLTAFTSSSSNNPGALKIVLIQGTPAVSPTAPSDVTIQASIGASNPFMALATIAVANGFTTIVTANITDDREVARFNFPSHEAVVLAESGQLVGTDTTGTGRSLVELSDSNYVKIGNETSAVSQGVITTTGSSNAYVLTLTPAITAYTSGISVKIKANHSCTGASTININGLGTKAITKNGATALSSGDIASGGVYELTYDGTQFQIAGGAGGSGATAATRAEIATGTSNTLMATPQNLHEFHVPPQGFLYNGKIVPSVSSNNLTVALKGLDGNDPSATNPVYVRIGNVIRTIVVATSTTLSAGTNRFNSGSAELATKEIDYFVYLYWNSSTNEVGIGFSRLPCFELASQSTNGVEPMFIQANSPNAGSTFLDSVNNPTFVLVNIGRFAATLSAGAGYTWSVPTFTALNLIQRPIYGTTLLNWVPQLTGCTAATYSSGNFRYQITGTQVTVEIGASAFMTSNATTKTITMPFLLASASSSQGTQYPVRGYDNGAALTAPAVLVGAPGSSTFILYKDFAWNAWTNTGLWLGQGFASYELF